MWNHPEGGQRNSHMHKEADVLEKVLARKQYEVLTPSPVTVRG